MYVAYKRATTHTHTQSKRAKRERVLWGEGIRQDCRTRRLARSLAPTVQWMLLLLLLIVNLIGIALQQRRSLLVCADLLIES